MKNYREKKGAFQLQFLLVDDNEINLETEKLLLESCGLTIVTAESGYKAIELTEKEDFFMIFMDLHMPGIDGFETSKKIHEKKPNIPIIALTADIFEDVEEQIQEYGINGFLSKPFDPRQLVNLLQKYLQVDQMPSEIAQMPSESIFDVNACVCTLKSKEALLRLVERFLNMHENDCCKISEEVSSGNYLHAREILHNIIGISGNLCCRKLYQVSCRISTELKQEEWKSISEFENIWEQTISALKNFQKLNEGQETELLGYQDFYVIKNIFLELCSDFDISAVDVFEDNRLNFKNNLDEKMFRDIENAVQKYDFLWITENFR